MGKKKPEMEVTEYRMSMHFGICTGPIDYIKTIYVGEKEAWTGLARETQVITIDNPELFGGIKKEGGVQGKATFMTGKSTQLFPAGLSAKFDLDPTEMPAYRGMATIFFSESDGAERNGFYWTANSPYLRGVWIKAARASVGLSQSIARIYRVDPLVALTPGTELSAGGTFSGGHQTNWDSNGAYAAHIEQGEDIVVWTLATGEQRTLPTAGANLLDNGGIHITKEDEIVYRTGGTFFGGPTFLKFYNAADLSLRQTIDLDPYQASSSEDVNAGIVMDDIVIDGQAWAMLKVRFNNTPPWMLLKRVGATWSVQWFEPGTTETDNLSMGREYAYGVKTGSNDEIVRVAWPTFSEDVIVPIDIGGRTILACHYHWDTDEVVVVYTNGDIVVYSPDLGTKLRESTGNDADLGRPEISSKRMTISPGTIVLPQRVSTISNVIEYLREISVDNLLVNRTITIANTSFVQKTSPFGQVLANRDAGGVFLAPSAAGPIAFWPFISTEDFDSNPAHMIFETQTNRSWGAGIATGGMDVDGYEAAAQTLYDEGFGLSMMWARQTTVEAFVKEVADHIEATIFLHPRTGLMTLKLIRGDYDVGTLPVYTPDNSKILNFKRKLYGETINEIVLTWTNPENEQEETVTVQDDANIAIQGGIVSDGRNYYGIRTADLATEVAYRDLRAAATPLASCDIEMDRSAWDHVPGDVIKITSPEDGISQLVMRVGPIDYGRNGNSAIRAALVEDVFSLAAAEYTTPPGTAWEDPSEEPSPADFSYVFTLPYFLVVNEVDPTVLAEDDGHPTVFAGVLAAEDGQDTAEFELWGELTDAGGNSYNGSLGTKTIISHGVLAADLVAEVTSVIASFDDRTQGVGPTVGGLLIIGDGEEDEVEFAYVSAFDISGYTIKRGVLDTVPRAWAAETPVWFIVHDHTYADDEPRSDGEVVEYQVLTRTSLGLLPVSEAPIISATLTGRPHLPSRPANVKVNGVAFSVDPIDLAGVNPIPVTWSERNRLTEDSVVLAWDAATVTPEAGQTTTVTLTDVDGVVLHAYTGLTGTSHDVDPADFGSEYLGYIVVTAERDGFESLQGYRLPIVLESAILLETGDYMLLETGDKLRLE